jgi:hypothetical protein
MVQGGQHFGLALEPGEAVGILRDGFRQDLDGDGSFQAGVGGANTSPMPPSPRRLTISWVPRRAPGASGTRLRYADSELEIK